MTLPSASRARLLRLLAVAGALCGCGRKTLDPTSLEVRVMSALAVPDQLDAVDVAAQTTQTSSYSYALVTRGTTPATQLPLSMGFTPNGDLTLPFEVDV